VDRGGAEHLLLPAAGLAYRHNRRVQEDLDPALPDPLGEALGEFGAGELLPELVEAEAVVDALHEDAPQVVLPVDQRAGQAGSVDLQGGGHAGRAGAHHYRVQAELLHSSPSSTTLAPPRLVTSSQPIPVSRIMILMILYAQNPPWQRPI